MKPIRTLLSLQFRRTKNSLSLDLCNCVGTFCSRLEAVEDGVVTFSDTILVNGVPQYVPIQSQFLAYIDVSTLCNDPCDPGVPNESPIVSEVIPAVDGCVEMMLNNAIFEAGLQYEYYVDSLTGELVNQYNEHCLGVDENFTYTYNDKLYHFTLYYYDQAGESH